MWGVLLSRPVPWVPAPRLHGDRLRGNDEYGVCGNDERVCAGIWDWVGLGECTMFLVRGCIVLWMGFGDCMK